MTESCAAGSVMFLPDANISLHLHFLFIFVAVSQNR